MPEKRIAYVAAIGVAQVGLFALIDHSVYTNSQWSIFTAAVITWLATGAFALTLYFGAKPLLWSTASSWTLMIASVALAAIGMSIVHPLGILLGLLCAIVATAFAAVEVQEFKEDIDDSEMSRLRAGVLFLPWGAPALIALYSVGQYQAGWVVFVLWLMLEIRLGQSLTSWDRYYRHRRRNKRLGRSWIPNTTEW